jgi:hypothetical protein
LSESVKLDQCQIMPVHDRLISNQVVFLNTFQSLGLPTLKPLVESYATCTYQNATHAQLLAFMATLMNLDLTTQADLTTHNVLATVLSVQVFLRDNAQQPFCLRRMLEHLDLNVLIKQSIDQALPMPIRANLDRYLQELSDFTSLLSVQEPTPFRPYMTHQAVIKPVQLLIDCLERPALQWLRARLDALQALIKEGGRNDPSAWQIAQELVTTNQRYQILTDDDLRALLRLRGLHPQQPRSLYRQAV